MVNNETYEEYKVRKGITNIHQANIVLGIDALNALKLTAKKLKEAESIIKLKNK